MKYRIVICLCVTSVAKAAPGDALGVASVWHPAACDGGSTAGLEQRLFAADQALAELDCSKLARAMGLLGPNPAAAGSVLDSVEGPLLQSRQWRWAKGRVALAQGEVRVAWSTLRPDADGWTLEPYTLWDLAVTAAAIGEQSVAREAYRRLMQSELSGERLRLAIRLEAAAVESRIFAEGITSARNSLAHIQVTDTDPDTCPWVSGMQVLLGRLQGDSAPGPRLPCSREAHWSRFLRSSEGMASLFAEVPRVNSWLRLPRNESLALVALSLGSGSAALRRRLWAAVDVPAQSALASLRQEELRRIDLKR